MDEREPDLIAYIYLYRYVYYRRLQETFNLEKACVIERTFISQLVAFCF